jgi:large subunit ribosomal protein L28
MAYKCEICGKRRRVANNVSHSNIKTKRTQRPNLHRVRALVNGQKVRIRVCTRCLRSSKIEKAV